MLLRQANVGTILGRGMKYSGYFRAVSSLLPPPFAFLIAFIFRGASFLIKNAGHEANKGISTTAEHTKRENESDSCVTYFVSTLGGRQIGQMLES